MSFQWPEEQAGAGNDKANEQKPQIYLNSSNNRWKKEIYLFREQDKMSSQGITNTTKDQLLHEQRKQEVLPQLLPISLFIILTNIVVFILFCSKPELRKVSNYLLFSLAICDFMNGSLNIPLFIVIFIPVVDQTQYASFLCAMEVSHNFVAIAAACHIFLITAEKYMAILRPLKYHVIKKKTVFLAITGAWLSSALLAAAPIGWFFFLEIR